MYTSPGTPIEVAEFDDGGYSYGVCLVGSYIYVADYEDGLNILHGTEHTITVTSPNSSSIWQPTTSQSISWTSTGSISEVDIKLYVNDAFYSSIVNGTDNDGSFMWTIPGGLSDSKKYQICISNGLEPSTFVLSDYFEIKTTEEKKVPGYNVGILTFIMATTVVFVVMKQLYRRK